MVFGSLLEILERITAPAHSAERACDLLTACLLVLDPSLHALGVKVSAAAELAVGEVLVLVHRLIAHAAVLAGLKWALFDPVSLLLEHIGPAKDVVYLIVDVPETAIVFVYEVVGLLVQRPLGSGAVSSLCPLVRISASDGSVSALEDLLDLTVDERQLPDQWVGLINLEDANQREDRVHAVLCAAAAAAARDLTTYLNLELLPSLILNRQLGRPVFLDKEESLTESTIVVVHELLQIQMNLLVI